MRRHARIAAPQHEMSLSIRSPLAAAIEPTQAAGGPKREVTKAHRPAWPGLGLVSGSRMSQAYALHGSMHRSVCNLTLTEHAHRLVACSTRLEQAKLTRSADRRLESFAPLGPLRRWTSSRCNPECALPSQHTGHHADDVMSGCGWRDRLSASEHASTTLRSQPEYPSRQTLQAPTLRQPCAESTSAKGPGLGL